MISTLPILIPLITVIALLFAGKRVGLMKIIGISGGALIFISSLYIFFEVKNEGIQITQAGGWKAPFGITLVIDLYSAVMLLISSFNAILVGIYALQGIDAKRHRFRFFLFFHTLMMGVGGAYIAGDLFNLYVWFEVMVLSSFVLISLGSEKEQLEGAIKYVTMNLLGSFLFLAGIGIVYGKTGTLNLADLAYTIRGNEQSFLMNSSFILFFMAFGIKAALFPFFFWLPSSYHTPPITITALFTWLLTKAVVYVMIRFVTLFMIDINPFWQNLLLILAALTMVIGVLMAASQFDIRRILSFHIISQIGYMIMGLGIFSTFAIAASMYFVIHNIMAKTAAFLAGGLIYQKTGTYNLHSIGGLFKAYPWLGLFFFLPAMALAGVPPLTGFFGKWFLIKAGFQEGHFWVTGISVWVSIVTLFSMLKIWNEAFWKQPQKEIVVKGKGEISPTMLYPAAILGFAVFFVGLLSGWLMDVLYEASAALKNPEIYIKAVLSEIKI